MNDSFATGDSFPTIEQRIDMTKRFYTLPGYLSKSKPVRDKMVEFPPYNTYLFWYVGKCFVVFLETYNEMTDGTCETCTVKTYWWADKDTSVFTLWRSDSLFERVPFKDLIDMGVSEPWKEA